MNGLALAAFVMLVLIVGGRALAGSPESTEDVEEVREGG